MSTGIIVLIVVIVVVVGAIAAVALAAARRRRLQERFGPEYDRAVETHESRRKAEAELSARERRVSKLDIRPLDPAARARYAQEWTTIQERFVDAPQGAVTQAQHLVVAVMTERGYPTEEGDDQQMMADLSVGHAAFVDHFRSARAISEQNTAGTASTEDLRQAVIHYRALFRELLGDSDGAATAGTAVNDTAVNDTAADETAADGTAWASTTGTGTTGAVAGDATPADTAPAGTVPAGTAAADGPVRGERTETGAVDPALEDPAFEDTPVDETPVDETPVDETPVDETPVAGTTRTYDSPAEASGETAGSGPVRDTAAETDAADETRADSGDSPLNAIRRRIRR